MTRQKRKANKLRQSIKQAAEYLFSGGVYFWTGYLVFFLCDKGLHLTLWWAKITADIVGWIINYGLQRFWVFRSPGLHQHRVEVTKRYATITFVDFILDYLIVRTLKNAGITPYIGQFVSAAFFTIWNYVWYRWWVFSNRYQEKRRMT